jgi:hypothetical protein
LLEENIYARNKQVVAEHAASSTELERAAVFIKASLCGKPGLSLGHVVFNRSVTNVKRGKPTI